jgi:heme/copper-type cytochrome/quinol oxidase subunit 2
MQCLEIELNTVTAVTAVVVVVAAVVLYLLIEFRKSRKMILQGEN